MNAKIYDKRTVMQAFKAINLFSLAALIGIELFLGIAVAKIIFYAPALTAESV